MSTVLSDPRSFVRDWAKQKGITVSAHGELICAESKTFDDHIDTMNLDYRSRIIAYNAAEKNKPKAQQKPVQPINQADLKSAICEFIIMEQNEYRIKFLDSIKCTKENLAPLEQWVKAVIGKDEPKTVAVFAHWICQSKRKMFGLTAGYHLCPTLVGKGRSGKTIAVARLTDPVKNYRLDLDLSQLCDDRKYAQFAQNYINVMDELAGSQKAEMEVIKRLITSEYVDYRPMKTNRVVKVKNNLSFIATSNYNVNEKIFDAVTMRRWVQIDCPDLLDHETINSIDYTELWQGINEEAADGYLRPFREELFKDQEKLITKDDVVIFMEEINIQPDFVGTGKTVTSEDLYQSYRHWATEGNYKVANKTWFGRKMSNRGIKAKVEKYGGKTCNVYNLNPDCLVYTKPQSVPYGATGN